MDKANDLALGLLLVASGSQATLSRVAWVTTKDGGLGIVGAF